MRMTHRLTARAAATAGAGKHADGAGLWLVKTGPSRGKWVLRFTMAGRRREMGLGPFPAVGLAEARRQAKIACDQVRQLKDPIRERARVQREATIPRRLEEIARDVFESRKPGLKGEGTNGRWFSPLEHHVLPTLGGLAVEDIDQFDIHDCLAPIWHAKSATARKALGRLGLCLEHAADLGLDVDREAARMARRLLGSPRHAVRNTPAMSWQDVPRFYRSLTGGSVAHLALRLLILTGVRSGALCQLREDQITGTVWTIPAEVVKGRSGATSAFRVPLVPEALIVLDIVRREARDGRLFPGRGEGTMSGATLSRLMAQRGCEARPHGFRSSLRDWLAEAAHAPYEVAETTLGHVAGSSVTRAYRRTDFLEERRAMLERWARHVTGQPGYGEAS